jgi:hypothetical protein
MEAYTFLPCTCCIGQSRQCQREAPQRASVERRSFPPSDIAKVARHASARRLNCQLETYDTPRSISLIRLEHVLKVQNFKCLIKSTNFRLTVSNLLLGFRVPLLALGYYIHVKSPSLYYR